MSFQQTLAIFQPKGMAQSDAGLQERRSAETRTTILEAAITCLAEHGYAKTTTMLVSSLARASRGAMLHHYPTRQALIQSTIEYAFYKRMKKFIQSIEARIEEGCAHEDRDLFIEVSDFETPEYKACLELLIASRTDCELRDVFLPSARKYDQVWRAEVLRAFPEWQKKGALFDRALELTQSLLEGLLINREVWVNPDGEHGVIGLLKMMLQMLRKGEITIRQPYKERRAPIERAAKA